MRGRSFIHDEIFVELLSFKTVGTFGFFVLKSTSSSTCSQYSFLPTDLEVTSEIIFNKRAEKMNAKQFLVQLSKTSVKQRLALAGLFGVLTWFVLFTFYFIEDFSINDKHYAAELASTCESWRANPKAGPFTSQFKQDAWLYQNFFKHRPLIGKGRFLDTASAYPLLISNTFFYETCLGWKGVCVDADPAKADVFRSVRPTCHYEAVCVSPTVNQTIAFWSSLYDGKARPVSDDPGMQFEASMKGWNRVEVPCKRLSNVLEAAKVTHVDLWSLDLEGHEMEAVDSMDFDRVKVDLIIAEDTFPDTEVSKRLVDKGFVDMGIVPEMSPIDFLFVHKDSIWYKSCTFTRSSKFWYYLGYPILQVDCHGAFDK